MSTPTANIPADQRPSVNLRATAEGRTAFLAGAWTVANLEQADKLLKSDLRAAGDLKTLDLAGLSHLDTAGAMLINLYAENSHCRIAGAGERFQKLLDYAGHAARADSPPADHRYGFLVFFHSVGAGIVEEIQVAWQLLGFTGYFLASLAAALARPWKLRLVSLVYHIEHTGVRAVPIVALLSFLIGMVTAYMSAAQLMRFGAQIFVINLLEISTLREMAVIITAILVAGRSGSSFTAQIGAMMANEEVAAMRSMGLDPMDMLVIPRVVALILTLPALVLIADFMGIFGGMMAVWLSMDLTPAAFMDRFRDLVNYNNFLVGMIKAPFFAMTIGLIGCFQGFQATGSAESVGRLTTQSVVEAIFMVIALDALFALLFTSIGF